MMNIPGLDYILWVTFQITGVVVWVFVLMVVAYFLLFELLLVGGINSFSYHRWAWKTDPNARITWRFLWSFFIHVFKFYGHRTTTITQYRSINGGHWRSAFDHSYSWRDRMDRLARIKKQSNESTKAVEGQPQ